MKEFFKNVTIAAGCLLVVGCQQLENRPKKRVAYDMAALEGSEAVDLSACNRGVFLFRTLANLETGNIEIHGNTYSTDAPLPEGVDPYVAGGLKPIPKDKARKYSDVKYAELGTSVPLMLGHKAPGSASIQGLAAKSAYAMTTKESRKDVLQKIQLVESDTNDSGVETISLARIPSRGIYRGKLEDFGSVYDFDEDVEIEAEGDIAASQGAQIAPDRTQFRSYVMRNPTLSGADVIMTRPGTTLTSEQLDAGRVTDDPKAEALKIDVAPDNTEKPGGLIGSYINVQFQRRDATGITFGKEFIAKDGTSVSVPKKELGTGDTLIAVERRYISAVPVVDDKGQAKGSICVDSRSGFLTSVKLEEKPKDEKK